MTRTPKAALRKKRPAARILLLDQAGRTLLFRFTPASAPAFWATPGGAVDPGESYEQAARRELLEETGLDMDPGPQVARRHVDFTTLEGVPVSADERYFRVTVPGGAIDTSRHTELEQRVMQEWRWFDEAAIVSHDEQIFPEDLLDLIRGAA
jgi:8-oxo-dGTP pyrophosphatase MutT (NUDIX family)